MTGSYFFLFAVLKKIGLSNRVEKKLTSEITPKVISGQIEFY